MSNPYYSATGNPGNQTRGVSQLVRYEFQLIQAAFDAVYQVGFTSSLPGQSGNAGKFIKTNGSSASWNSIDWSDVVNKPITLVADGGITTAKFDPLAKAPFAANADSATTATSAGNITGIASILNGGTGASTASTARAALGLAIGTNVAASGANTDITSLSALQSINGGQIAGLRNKIINGGMMVDQRNAGAAQTFTAAAALAYAVDRWYGYCTGANVTGQRVAGTAPNKFNYRFTGAASVTKIGYAQRIEAANCQDLAGTTATLSVDLANSLLTTVTWTAWYATTEDTFGTLASPTRTQIATGTFTVSSTLARYNAQITIPGAATTGIEVEFSVGAQTSGTWTIGRAQLEQGSVATAFEHRQFGAELALCQRYFQKVTGQIAGTRVSVAGYASYVTWYFKTEMRVAPTMIYVACSSDGSSVTTTMHTDLYSNTLAVYPVFGIGTTATAEL